MDRTTRFFRACPAAWVVSVMVLAVMCLSASPVAGQLDESCTVSALNRAAQVRADGSYYLSGIPADTGPVRVRATCARDGVTTIGASQFFTPIEGGEVLIPDIVFAQAPSVPARLLLQAPAAELAGAGETAQLIATGIFPDGLTGDLTPAVSGTAYSSSNTAVATVDPEGLVTAVAGGTVLISALHEGALGVVLLRVTFPAGEDSDGDGLPDSVEDAFGLDANDPIDAFLDLDGDGLANLDEFLLGTGLADPDSDDDSIFDGEETAVGIDGFLTNPLLADTDGDLLRDALEILIGTDPTDPTSFDYGAALTQLTVSPTALLLPRYLGDPPSELTGSLQVIGELIDGTSLELTSSLRGTTYGSSDLLVCGFTVNDGEVLAGIEGRCEVTVRNGAFSAVAEVQVRTIPAALGSVALPGFANDVAVDLAAGFAYVAGGGAGLLVIDVSDPEAPTLVGSADTDGVAIEVALADGLAYLADGVGGLVILDITDAANPARLATLAIGGRALDLAVADGLAVVAAEAAGLVVVDVSDPQAPVLLTSFLPPSGGLSRAVARRDDGLLALAAAESGQTRVSILDLTMPSAPAVLSTLPAVAGEPFALTFRGDRLLAAGLFSGRDGLIEIDVADPASAVELARIPREVGGLAHDVAAVGNLAFVADIFFAGAIPIVDLAEPEQATAAGYLVYDSRGNGNGVVVADTLVFLVEDFSQAPYGTEGNSRLRIGQFVPRPRDTGGIPPTVTFSQPQDGDALVGGRTIVAAVDAADDSAVASVTFLAAGEIISVDTAAPYAVELTLPAGPQALELRAVARDSGGNQAEDSLTLDILANQPPTVTVTGPADGAAFFVGDSVPFTASASDADGTVTGVEFFIDGVSQGVDTSVPFATTFVATAEALAVVLEAVVTDDLGVVASDQVTVSVLADPPPVVNLTRPAATDVAVAELPLVIEAEATDNDPIASVRILVDGVEVFSSATPPYRVAFSVPVDATALLIEAIVRDRDDQEATDSLTVPVVASDPPTVAISAPLPGIVVDSGSLLAIEATATDDVGVVAVDLMVDGVVVATLTSPPYRVDQPVPSGVESLAISARATDTAGQTSDSAIVAVTVQPSAPPLVALTAPVSGTVVVAGESVAVSAEANDDIGVTEVRFLVDGVLTATDATAPFGFDLTVPSSAGPTLELVAEAVDTDGQATASSAVVIEVAASASTRVVGRVVDQDDSPVGGAEVTCGSGSATTFGDGSFEIAGLPVDEGDIGCRATAEIGGVLTEGRSLPVDPVPGGVTSAGDIVLTGATFVVVNDLDIELLDPADGSRETLFAQLSFEAFPVATAVRPDGFILVVNGNGELQMIDGVRGRVVGDLGPAWTIDPLFGFSQIPLRSIAIHPLTGEVFGIDDFDGVLFRLEGGAQLTRLGPTGSDSGSEIAFAPDGTLYQIVSNERVLKVLDIETGAAQQTIPVAEDYLAMAIHPVDGTAYVASADELLTLDLSTGLATPLLAIDSFTIFDLTIGALRVDRGTAAVGTVVDDEGLPLAGARVTCAEVTGETAPDGSFTLSNLSSAFAFRCRAAARTAGGERLRGSSADLMPVAGGAVDVGVMTLRSVGSALYGGLRFAAGGEVAAAASGDVDGDGFDDAVVALTSDEVSVMLMSAPGLPGPPQRFAVGANPSDVELADLDSDGDLDVVAVNNASQDISVLLGTGSGSFLAETRLVVGSSPVAVAVADFDLDGFPDLAVANTLSQDLSVLYGNGDGTFEPDQRLALGFSPGGLGTGDFTGDGRPDLVLSVAGGFSNEIRTAITDSSGRLQPGPSTPTCCRFIGITVADFDGDGHDDVVGKGVDSGELMVVLGRGDGTFDGATQYVVDTISTSLSFNAGDVVVGDVEGDGRLDIAWVHSYQATVLRGLPLGGFGDRRQFPLPARGSDPLDGRLTGEEAVPLKIDSGLVALNRTTAGDFDGDGTTDLAVALETELSLFYGSDSVELPFCEEPERLAMADLNGDGYDDLLAWPCELGFVAGVGYQLSDGAGGFGSIAGLAAESPMDVGVADLDGDGVVDVAVATEFGGPTLYRGLGDGVFEESSAGPNVATPSSAIVAVDLDLDGHVDLALAGGLENLPELLLLFGNGDLTFQAPVVIDLEAAGASGVEAMITAELNGDGKPDLLTANPDNQTMTIIRSLPSGEYQRFSVLTFGATAAVGAADFNRDGRVDLAAVTGSDAVRIAFGNANGLYDLPISVPIENASDLRGLAVVHVDDDGFEDLLIADHLSDQVVVLLGRGDGSFDNAQQIGVGSRPEFLTTGDLDGDGKPDLAVVGAGFVFPELGQITRPSLGLLRHH